MATFSLPGEAAECWTLAQWFAGRPEEALLLRLAEEFERLAVQSNWPTGFDEDDGQHFARRARQECSAAVDAKHPSARLAHLKMAQRYERLAQSLGTRARSS
jgi:TorA maturation chaperone TorD